MLSNLTRLCTRGSSTFVRQSVRCYSTDSYDLARKAETSNSISELDSVLKEVKDKQITDISVYDVLMRKYSKIQPSDGNCAEVFITADILKISDKFSQESLDIYSNVMKSHLLDDNDDLSGLDYITKDYQAYKESKTRRPWLNKN
ncbi:hypothetical protein CYY_004980 [Polysphondylium violaceum]|uniref:Uncharacterized protein n=1 Tax=Polysphondylium violaceum TaxID=133409 RepID=A0A8J4Q4D6_9MYCE|nr:hypothetical protein CYY_004980 [Polysphondylium violaceum]